MENFTERLSFLISDILGMSGNALAKDMDMNQGLVSRYRKGETKPPYDFIAKLCYKYGISSNWLLLNIYPVKLNEIETTECDDWSIKRVEEKKELAKSFEEIIECINEIKEKHSL